MKNEVTPSDADCMTVAQWLVWVEAWLLENLTTEAEARK